jgi:hypothetical protein
VPNNISQKWQPEYEPCDCLPLAMVAEIRATRSSLIPALRSNFASLLFSWRASTAPRFFEMCFCTFCSDLGMMRLIRQVQLYQRLISLVQWLISPPYACPLGNFFFFWLAETQGGGVDTSPLPRQPIRSTCSHRVSGASWGGTRDSTGSACQAFHSCCRHSLMVILAAASLISRTCAPRRLLSLGLLLMLH